MMNTNIKQRKIITSVNALKKTLILVGFTAVFFSGNAQNWSLQQCIDTAQVNNKNLQISRNAMEISVERQKEAKANLIPKINLNADYKYFVDLPYQLMPQSAFGGPEGLYKEVQMGVPHNMGANIQLAMPLYNSQIYSAIKTSKIAAELNELQYKKTAEQVFFEISNLYYNAQILIHQIVFIDSNLVNTKKLLENLELLYSQQMIKKSDITKIDLQIEQLSTQRKLVENNFQQVVDALKFSMGILGDQNIGIEPEIKKISSTDYTNSTPVDVQIAQTQNKILTSELTALKASRLPTVSIFGSYGQVGFGYDEKPNDFLNFYPTSFAGLQLTVPLFNGTVTKRKINKKKLEIDNSKLQIDLVADQNRMLVENAKRNRLVTQQTIKNTAEQVSLANTVYNEMVLQQKEGTASLTEVLLADNEVREAQTSNLSAIINFLKADLELKKLKSNKETTEKRVYQYDKEKPISVQFMDIKTEKTENEHLYSGTFEPNKESKISADFQGKVMTVFVDLGTTVQKGQTLILLDNSLLKLQLQSIEIQIESLETDVKRYSVLASANAIQGVQLEKAELGLKTAKVQKATLLEQIRKTSIRAPFNGIVTSKFTEEGAFAAPGMPLLQITDISNLKFTLNVSEDKLSQFNKGQVCSVSADVYPEILLLGKVDMIGSKANMGNSYPIQLALKNTEDIKIKSGMFGKVTVKHSSNTNQIIIPASAMVGTTINPQVYVIKNGSAVLQNIIITERLENKVVISQGISEGDRVVTNGFINLYDGAKVNLK